MDATAHAANRPQAAAGQPDARRPPDRRPRPHTGHGPVNACTCSAEDAVWSNGRPETPRNGATLPAVRHGWYCAACAEANAIDRDGPTLAAALDALRERQPPLTADEDVPLAVYDSSDDQSARAIERIACDILERTTGIAQVPPRNPAGPHPMPAAYVDALARVLAAERSGAAAELRDVVLSPGLAARIATRLHHYARSIHEAARKRDRRRRLPASAAPPPNGGAQ